MDKKILSVANVNSYIKQLMDRDFILKNLWVQGEISNYKAHSSGHLYFTLKDGSSAISCVMFRSYVQTLESPLKNGSKVLVNGSVSVYERSGQYQIYVKQIKEDGVGKLYQAYEKLKKQLASEGLFEEEVKKPIPPYVKTVGVVTSSTGAAIRDIVQVANRRNPYVQLRLYPSLVQGPDAAVNIVKAINYFNLESDQVDVLIVGRGGGSIEDLWPFNEEIVARAIATSEIPIISAVGHETDFTIADFVADHRAPTPSAASEIAVYDYGVVMHKLGQYENQLKQWLDLQLVNKKKVLSELTLRLKHQHPRDKFERKYQYIAELEDKLNLYLKRLLTAKKQRLALVSTKLEGLSPTARLKNGYAYISDGQHNKIDSVKSLRVGDGFMLTLSDGQIHGTVDAIEEEDK